VAIFRTLFFLAGTLLMVGCTADPDAPINQAVPIRQMDNFSRSLRGLPPLPPTYTRQPGYAPAYPPYSPG
jgi:hypothetical protein